jgi:adenosylcobinamide kinase / adenosylcobinamide-phosphate guanylyltransferase
MLTLITGGARSGKSRHAQSLCANVARVAYVATGINCDDEMRKRIRKHRDARPASWQTIEEPLELSAAVSRHAPENDIVLIDCLTLWLSNFCWHWRESEVEEIEQAVANELNAVIETAIGSHLIIVTNEVGSGVVPESRVGRYFRDLQGFANQQIAEAADSVYLAVAGIAIRIKPSGMAT